MLGVTSKLVTTFLRQMIKSVQIVLGTFFGDEGKGSTVQWLTTKNSLVVRFSGGPQCGHRVLRNGMEHVCSLVGSGVLRGAATYLHKDVYIDPISLNNELFKLQIRNGICPKVYVHPDCRVITPYDIIQDYGNNKVRNDGTCGCGIHATFVRSTKCPITFKEVMENSLSALNKFHHRRTELDAPFVNSCITLSNKVIIKKDAYLDYEHVVLEGSQGLLLDMDNGFMPHCTPSRVGLNGVPEELLEDAEVFLVMRSYLTRHGNGYEPSNEDLIRKTYRNLDEPTNLDTGHQGKFKIGVFDIDLLQDALNRSHLDNYARMYNVKFNAVVTHMDCTPRENALTIRDGGHIMEDFPLNSVFDLSWIRRIIKVQNIYKGICSNSNIQLFR